MIWDFNQESINFCFSDAQFVVRFFSSPRKHNPHPTDPDLDLGSEGMGTLWLQTDLLRLRQCPPRTRVAPEQLRV